MNDTYKEIGFDSNRIGFGRRAGIVVVDFQKGFTESRFPLGGRPMVDRAVNNTVKLVSAARKAGLPVACCYTAYSSARDAPLWKIPAVVNEFHHGHPSTELDERIYDKTYDMIVCKTAPSIFFNTAVASYFIKDGVDT
jgi:maleamate amidohydrolase